ncbi:Mur ligase [Thermoanaerobacter sp. YS13]|uniref:Mur ligase family protein n=1 Tax=Thermoanaerobacter sp. YS13 TaxID=1511746 RepID=UPI000574F314|nr:Mur ligase family protein [Thermoanaerobacter sp. YS13]KHO62089.1 Mur ligase [Thermoanaerobacter sp. YS13]
MVYIFVGGSSEKSSIIKFLSYCVHSKKTVVEELKNYKEKTDILIISDILREEDFHKLKNYIYSFPSSIMITNADDELSNKLFAQGINSTLITCGLNPKSSITASSISYEEEGYEFNYCVQRSFFNLKGKLIEPLEIPVEIKVPGQYNIYNSLFVITVLLILGYEIKDIQNVVKTFENSGR